MSKRDAWDGNVGQCPRAARRLLTGARSAPPMGRRGWHLGGGTANCCRPPAVRRNRVRHGRRPVRRRLPAGSSDVTILAQRTGACAVGRARRPLPPSAPPSPRGSLWRHPAADSLASKDPQAPPPTLLSSFLPQTTGATAPSRPSHWLSRSALHHPSNLSQRRHTPASRDTPPTAPSPPPPARAGGGRAADLLPAPPCRPCLLPPAHTV